MCFQQLSSELRATIRLQPSLAHPGSEADDLLITQLRFQHCHWGRVNVPPLQRDKTVYFSPLQLRKVSSAIWIFNLALAFSFFFLWRDRPRKRGIPDREEAQQAPAGLGARHVVRYGHRAARLGWKRPHKVRQRVSPTADQITPIAVHGCWACSSSAGGCDTLVAKVVACYQSIRSAFLCSTPVGYVRDLLHGADDLFHRVGLFQITGLFQISFDFTATLKWSFFSRLLSWFRLG